MFQSMMAAATPSVSFGCTLLLLISAAVCSARGWQDTLAGKSEAARQAVQTGNYAQAVTLYRELIAALPGNPGLHLNLGLALEGAGQPSAAVPELQRAMRDLPDSATAPFLLGLAYQQLHQPALAIAPLRKAVHLDGSNQQARFELADAELAAGEIHEAISDFEGLTRQNPALPKAWQAVAMSYVALGDAFIAKLNNSGRKSAFGYALLARTRSAEQRYSEALELYRKALRQSPALKGLHAASAEIYRETNHADWAALEEQREAQIAKPDCASHPAACAFEAQDWKKAVADGQMPTAENLYWAILGAGKLAEESLHRLSELPSSGATHEILADSYARAGHRMEAIEQWRQALALQPNDQRLQARLAESLVRARRYDEATKLLTPLVAAQPGNSEWEYFLGDALFEQGRPDEALPHLAKSVQALPNYLPAQEALGRVYLALERPANAVPCLEQALPLDNDGSVSFALSVAYRRLDRTAESQAALLRYRKLNQNKGEAAPPRPTANLPPP